MAEEEMLTVDEVASRLKTRPEAVRRWLRDGRLMGLRLGGTRAGWRIRSSEVDRFIVEREGRPMPSHEAG